MVNLGHQSFPPTALGRQEYEEATPGIATIATLWYYRLNCTHQSKLGIETRSSLSNHVSANMSAVQFCEIT
ncbi:hypothetical protein TNCV_1676391 [Trichonephila clavipes]|nr:hypothetical protein TNCV_1676391 [Trichonephila clavipes]